MPRFSLIVPTFDRTEEFASLLRSLADQKFDDYELIVVDQNGDDRLVSLFSLLPEAIPRTRIRCEPNLSAARNRGLEAAAGDIVAFPDDDCLYSPGLLANLDGWFRQNEQYAVLAVGALDENGVPSGNRWIQSACDINPWNAVRTTFCSSLFVRRAAIPDSVRFDETINRGEETDFILHLLETGLRGRFDRTWHVVHPCRDMLSGTVSGARAFSYGAGMGNLARRHSLFGLWLALLSYDLARAVSVTLRGRLQAASRCFAHTCGLFSGYVRGQTLQ